MYAAPHLRGRGQADRLMQEVEEWLTAQGVSKIMLDASAVNERAVAFYEKMDYVTERVRMVKRFAHHAQPGMSSGGPDNG